MMRRDTLRLAPHLVRLGSTVTLPDKTTGPVVKIGKVYIYVGVKGGIRRLHPNAL